MDKDAAALAAALAPDFITVHSDDEYKIRRKPGFLPVSQYGKHVKPEHREIGMLNGKRVVVTDLHSI